MVFEYKKKYYIVFNFGLSLDSPRDNSPRLIFEKFLILGFLRTGAGEYAPKNDCTQSERKNKGTH